ncbi:hypothetical protein J6590_029318 [Homalodisca vitripennis]|nr:hypothetical protein J6590_029318 [Homalodisca vitripennis]
MDRNNKKLRSSDILDLIENGNLSEIDDLSENENEDEAETIPRIRPPEDNEDDDIADIYLLNDEISDLFSDVAVSNEITLESNLINVGQTATIRKKRGRPASTEDLPSHSTSKERTSEEVQPSKAMRRDTVDHLPEVDSKKEATRCKNQNCKGKTHVFCTKCQVHLCLLSYRNCFIMYHT